MARTKHEATHTNCLKTKNWIYVVKSSLLHLLQKSVQVLHSVSSSVGPSMAISIFHCCLVRSQPVTGICRVLAGLFTFLSRQPVVNLSLELVKGTDSELSSGLQKTTHLLNKIAAKGGWSHTHMNSGKLVTWLETDWGSELPLPFSDTHLGLAELSKFVCSNNCLCNLMPETESEQGPLAT